MRLLICAGMTGGGVFPALAILQASNIDSRQVLWIGSEGGMEADIVSHSGLTFETIPAAGVHGVGLNALPANLIKLIRGWNKARQLIRAFKPDVLLFTGGYVGVPVALAAASTPSLVFIPDIEPGIALKVIVKRASLVCATTDETRRFLPKSKNFLASGYPLRQQLTEWKHSDAKKYFDLEADKPVLLIFGGSKGAQTLNNAVIPILPALLEKNQVIHVWGRQNWKQGLEFQASLPEDFKKCYRAFAFLDHDMGAAFAAADLAVCRAGASSLGELPYFGLPAILVPYPYAWHYQKQNANYLAEKKAAQILIDDENLSEKILEKVTEILNDTSLFLQMRNAMFSLKKDNAASEIALALKGLLKAPQTKGDIQNG